MVATIIDLSRVPVPDAIEPLSVAALESAYIQRFLTQWAAARVIDPRLPVYDVETLQTDPARIIGQAVSYGRLLDRARVNDAVRAVLAPTARGADLDNVVARWDVQRLIVPPATAERAAVYESDAQLLRRYLLAVDRPSAGSADRYLYEAYTAFPGMQDAVVLGRSVHGRRGDVDIVIAGPNGDAPTTQQIAAVRAAVTAPDVKPEATWVNVVAATRATYTASLLLQVPPGPDPAVVVSDARVAVQAAAAERCRIGAEVPVESISGPAYRPNVIRVTARLPAQDIPAHPYTIPVCTGFAIEAEIRR